MVVTDCVSACLSVCLCRSVSISQPLMKCKRVFQALINIAIEELCETANSLIAPVRLGAARPTASFSLVTSNIDAVQVSNDDDDDLMILTAALVLVQNFNGCLILTVWHCDPFFLYCNFKISSGL